MKEINIQVSHELDLEMFPGKAKDALGRLLKGNWDGFGANDANSAITTLYDTLRQSAGANGPAPQSPKKINEKRAVNAKPEDLRRCMFAIGEVWAIIWFNRGKFEEKLNYYMAKDQEYNLRPVEEVYLQGLLKLKAGPSTRR